MDTEKIQSLSNQLAPLAQSLVKLLALADVAINPANLTPWYDRSTNELCYGKNPRDPTMAVIRFGIPTELSGSGWTRKLGEAKIIDSIPIEAIRQSWPNNSAVAIQVTLDRTVSITEGVQRVISDSNSWNHSWNLGTSAKVTLGSKASGGIKAGPASANAEISSSVELAINASYSGSSSTNHGETQTQNKATTTTRKVQQNFTVPPYTKFTAVATYTKETLTIPYIDTLPIDLPFKLPPLRLRYGTYFGNGQVAGRYDGPDVQIQSSSLRNWLNGFYGTPPAESGSFRHGIDLTFPQTDRDKNIVSHIEELKNCLCINRKGAVDWTKASGFEFQTHSATIIKDNKKEE